MTNHRVYKKKVAAGMPVARPEITACGARDEARFGTSEKACVNFFRFGTVGELKSEFAILDGTQLWNTAGLHNAGTMDAKKLILASGRSPYPSGAVTARGTLAQPKRRG
jgi:hypothetical protein